MGENNPLINGIERKIELKITDDNLLLIGGSIPPNTNIKQGDGIICVTESKIE